MYWTLWWRNLSIPESPNVYYIHMNTGAELLYRVEQRGRVILYNKVKRQVYPVSIIAVSVVVQACG